MSKKEEMMRARDLTEYIPAPVQKLIGEECGQEKGEFIRCNLNESRFGQGIEGSCKPDALLLANCIMVHLCAQDLKNLKNACVLTGPDMPKVCIEAVDQVHKCLQQAGLPTKNAKRNNLPERWDHKDISFH